MPRRVSRRINKTVKFESLPAPRTRVTDSNDKTGVALYHVVYEYENFDHAAQAIFSILLKAAREFPGKPRYLYLDIDGHRNLLGGFDSDMWELQQEFCIGFLMPWLQELTVPMGMKITNPKRQREDVPERLEINQPKDR